jgi:hypothetical protein
MTDKRFFSALQFQCHEQRFTNCLIDGLLTVRGFVFNFRIVGGCFGCNSIGEGEMGGRELKES